MATTNFTFTATVGGVFDDIDFYAGHSEIMRIDGKYRFKGRIPSGGFLNIAVDTFGDNGQQIDLGYSCKDDTGLKHEDPVKPSVVTTQIEAGRYKRVTLRIPF
jgi:hypothetical protein